MELQSKPRMSADRHWERFDESDHGNDRQMRSVAEDAIEELLKRDSEKPNLNNHHFRELVNDLRDTAEKYAGTQQLREQLSGTLRKYINPRGLG